MKKQVWIIFTIVLVACLVLLLLKTTQQQQKTAALPEESEALTNQPSQPEQPKAVENRQVPNTSRPLPLPASATPLAQTLAKTNPVAAMRLALWQAPIEFYGKVVDENSNALAGVNIHFSW